jgi:cytochrome c553
MTVAARVLFTAALGAVMGAACIVPDPIHEKKLDRLGEETANGPSAFHRAGQACGTCHRPDGEAKQDFTVAGTVFAGPDALVGVEGVEVQLVDSAGTSPVQRVTTNCVGNFFVPRASWDAAFPVLVRLRKGDVVRTMNTPIGRAASCADCHEASSPPRDPHGRVSAVYLFGTEDPAGPPKECPIEPDRRKQ